MTKFVKFAALAAAVLATTPALAAPVSVTGAPPAATVKIVRPLSLTATGSGTARLAPDGSSSTSGSLGAMTGRAMVGSV
ncbi:MAG: hypothetical protein ABIN83_05165, partial [Sphingomicrobium sp.]